MEDIRRGSQGLTYVYRLPDGKQQVFPGERVFHVRGLSPDGIRGYSPIADFARRLVKLGLAVEALRRQRSSPTGRGRAGCCSIRVEVVR
jgi:hypothetical protein